LIRFCNGPTSKNVASSFSLTCPRKLTPPTGTGGLPGYATPAQVRRVTCVFRFRDAATRFASPANVTTANARTVAAGRAICPFDCLTCRVEMPAERGGSIRCGAAGRSVGHRRVHVHGPPRLVVTVYERSEETTSREER
jgi:hypothetical protein